MSIEINVMNIGGHTEEGHRLSKVRQRLINREKWQRLVGGEKMQRISC